MSWVLAAALGYLLGSVPYGLLLTKAAGFGDVRLIGSGSTGATNVLRTGNKALAAGTLALDLLKGVIAVLVAAHLWGRDAGLLAGFAAVVGHCYPVWLGFKGGKGVATAAGVLLAANWWLGLLAGLVWLATALATRISSASALMACAVTPVIAALTGDWMLALFCLLLAALIAWRHKANIQRILAGTEPKIGKK